MVTIEVIGTLMILEIMVENHNQITDPWKKAVLMDKVWVLELVIDLVMGVVAMVVECYETSFKKDYSS